MHTITKEFRFEAAHIIDGHPGKCANLHGHSYISTVEFSGPVSTDTGMVIDYYEVSKLCDPIFETLDHSFLTSVKPGEVAETLEGCITNEVLKKGCKVTSLGRVTTAENLARFLHESVTEELTRQYPNFAVKCTRVTVKETVKTSASYGG